MTYEAKGGYVFLGKDCVAICDTDNGTQAEYDARAKLFAASDEMLAACRKVVNNWGDLHAKDLQQLRAAIAKATA